MTGVVRGRFRAYLQDMTEATSESPRRAILPAILAGGLAGLVLAGTVTLWFHYGTAVFFEIVRAGIAACF